MTDSHRSLQVIRGVRIPVHPVFVKERIEQAMDFRPLDGDIIVLSYPKTGSHWLSYAIMQIVSRGELFPEMSAADNKIMPMMEAVGGAVLTSMEPPRKCRSNLPYDVMTKNPKSKVLYIHRHPEDVFVSYFHFVQGIFDRDIDVGECFSDFLKGNVAYGLYFDHLVSVLEHRADDNLLLLSYEDMSGDHRGQILRIAEFLGEEYHRPLAENNSVVEKILQRTSFEYMKTNLSYSIFGQQEPPRRMNFFRNGIVGDGKCVLTLEQRGMLRKKAAEYLEGTDIFQKWYN